MGVTEPDAAVDRMLAQALDALVPSDLLLIGCSPAVSAYRQSHPECRVTVCESLAALETLDGSRHPADEHADRRPLGVVSALDSRSEQSALSLIAALRDRYCQAVLVTVRRSYWSFADWLALGFELRATCRADREEYALYWFDRDRCNPEREWNNPTDWAHPENFDRFRW